MTSRMAGKSEAENHETTSEDNTGEMYRYATEMSLGISVTDSHYRPAEIGFAEAVQRTRSAEISEDQGSCDLDSQALDGRRSFNDPARTDSFMTSSNTTISDSRSGSVVPGLSHSVYSTDDDLSGSEQPSQHYLMNDHLRHSKSSLAQPTPIRHHKVPFEATLQMLESDKGQSQKLGTGVEACERKISFPVNDRNRVRSSSAPPYTGHAASYSVDVRVAQLPTFEYDYSLLSSSSTIAGPSNNPTFNASAFTCEGSLPLHQQLGSGLSPGNGDPIVDETIASDRPSNDAQDATGYPCIFCKSIGGEDPTSQCSWPREFTSRLKKHHLHRKHPGGPFGCCQRCFAIGRNCGVPGAAIFTRFSTEEEVLEHERSCSTHKCIDEACDNYDQRQNATGLCGHDLKPTQRQIWRMWYRRARGLGRYALIPEPHQIATGLRTPSNASSRRPQPTRHMLTPSNSPALLSGQDYTECEPATSSAGDLRSTGSLGSDVHGSLSNNTEHRLRTLAIHLLFRITSDSPSWSETLAGLHANTMRAASRRIQALSGVDLDTIDDMQTLCILIEKCRRLLEHPASRNPNAWWDVRAAADVAGLGGALPSQLEVPAQWFQSQVAQDQPIFAQTDPSHVVEQMGTWFQNVPQEQTPYQRNIEGPGGNTNNFVHQPSTQGQMLFPPSNVTYDRDAFTQPGSDQTITSGNNAAGVETGSTASDSGLYINEGSSQYSGKGKDPVDCLPDNAWYGPQ